MLLLLPLLLIGVAIDGSISIVLDIVHTHTHTHRQCVNGEWRYSMVVVTQTSRLYTAGVDATKFGLPARTHKNV